MVQQAQQALTLKLHPRLHQPLLLRVVPEVEVQPPHAVHQRIRRALRVRGGCEHAPKDRRRLRVRVRVSMASTGPRRRGGEWGGGGGGRARRL
jgi:hypothetical protein